MDGELRRAYRSISRGLIRLEVRKARRDATWAFIIGALWGLTYSAFAVLVVKLFPEVWFFAPVFILIAGANAYFSFTRGFRLIAASKRKVREIARMWSVG